MGSSSKKINAKCLIARFASEEVEQILATQQFMINEKDTRLVAYW
jgi:hypothetical protein